MTQHTRRVGRTAVLGVGLGLALTVLPTGTALADTDYCNDIVGASVEDTLRDDGAVAAFGQMNDEFYTTALSDLPAHYYTCPAVSAAINAGAEHVVMKASPKPWWEAFWAWFGG